MPSYRTDTSEYDIKRDTKDNISLLNEILDTTPPPPERIERRARQPRKRKNQKYYKKKASQNSATAKNAEKYGSIVDQLKDNMLDPVIFLALYYAFHTNAVALAFQKYLPKMFNDRDGRVMYYVSRGAIMYGLFIVIKHYLDGKF